MVGRRARGCATCRCRSRGSCAGRASRGTGSGTRAGSAASVSPSRRRSACTPSPPRMRLAGHASLCTVDHVPCPPPPPVPLPVLLQRPCRPAVPPNLCRQHRRHVLPHPETPRARHTGAARSMGLRMVSIRCMAASSDRYSPGSSAAHQPPPSDQTVKVESTRVFRRRNMPQVHPYRHAGACNTVLPYRPDLTDYRRYGTCKHTSRTSPHRIPILSHSSFASESSTSAMSSSSATYPSHAPHTRLSACLHSLDRYEPKSGPTCSLPWSALVWYGQEH